MAAQLADRERWGDFQLPLEGFSIFNFWFVVCAENRGWRLVAVVSVRLAEGGAHEMFCLRLGNVLREGRNSPLPKLNFRHLRRPSSADNSSPTQSSERSHPKKMYSDERISGDANTGSKLPEDGKLVCVTHSGIYCAYIGKVTRHEDSQHDV
jgi:hypothetical protein